MEWLALGMVPRSAKNLAQVVWAQILYGNCPRLCEDLLDELQIRHIVEVLVEIPRISQASLKSAAQHKSIDDPHVFVLCSAGTSIPMRQI